jgi:ketosteroid isomerase-like protein
MRLAEHTSMLALPHIRRLIFPNGAVRPNGGGNPMRISGLLAIAAIAGLGAISSAAYAAPALADTIMALEQARLAAFRAGDRAAFDRLVADDATMVHSNGDVGTKAEEMALMHPPTADHPLPTLDLEGMAVRGYGDSAVLTGSLVEKTNGQVVLRLRFTNFYAKRNSAWKFVAGQLTRAAAN